MGSNIQQGGTIQPSAKGLRVLCRHGGVEKMSAIKKLMHVAVWPYCMTERNRTCWTLYANIRCQMGWREGGGDGAGTATRQWLARPWPWLGQVQIYRKDWDAVLTGT